MRLSRHPSPYVLTLFLLTLLTLYYGIALADPYHTFSSITAVGAGFSMSTYPSLAAAVSPVVSVSPTPAAQSTSPLTRGCKLCPPGNPLSLTCYKNTQCVPVSLLCNTTFNSTSNLTIGTNPCMDATGSPAPDDPIECLDQLCYPKNYLPLPAPGSGKIDSNSVSNCLKGNYFSLYGSASGMRYTRSCIGQFSASNNITCNSWEYRAQNSCFLSTCGPGMDCEPPFICRIGKKTSSVGSFGLCRSPNSTTDPTEDGVGEIDATAAKDHLILGILVGVCTLVLGVGVAAACWRLRKNRQKLLRQLDSRDHDSVLREKTLLLYACCCLGGDTMRWHGRGGISDDGVPAVVDTQGQRVAAVEEPESQEGSLTTDNRSNIIYARRWRWAQGRIVVPEIEPPPVYHQGELPIYRGSDVIPLESLDPVVADTSEATPTSEASAQGCDEGQTSVPIP